MKRESKAGRLTAAWGTTNSATAGSSSTPDVAFGGGEWRRYEAGRWQPVEDLAVEAQVMDVLER